jgi:hypothetical protein
MNDELYEVQAEGERLDHGQKLVVERARLTARVKAWPDLARALAMECIWRVRDLAVRELELANEPAAAELGQYREYLAAAEFASAILARSQSRLSARTGAFLGFLADSVAYTSEASGPAAAARYAAYIAAYASDRATPDPAHRLPPGLSPFEIERRRQAAVLAQGLGP